MSDIVFITGATGQLGMALCKAYLDAGATVIGTDKNLHSDHQVDGVEYKALDITDQTAVATVMESVAKEYGVITVLINNAGVSCFEPFEERPEESFNWVMDTNLKGTFFCIQSYVRLYDLKRWSSGTVVNIASLYGIVSPDPRIYTDSDRKNSEIYGATKAGIIQMTKYFAVHLADRGIRVNAVSPGGILNPAHPQGPDFQKNYGFRCPLKRMAITEEVVGPVLFLSSNAASYITGHNLIVDGGVSCW